MRAPNQGGKNPIRRPNIVSFKIKSIANAILFEIITKIKKKSRFLHQDLLFLFDFFTQVDTYSNK